MSEARKLTESLIESLLPATVMMSRGLKRGMDANNMTETGIYYCAKDLDNTGYPSDSVGYGILIVLPPLNGRLHQIYLPDNLSKVYFRRRISGVWGEWRYAATVALTS